MRSWRVFSKTRQIRVICGQLAGGPYRQWSALSPLSPFFAALRERAGPVTWVVMIACVVVFIAMQILGDQEVMLWLAWPFDPTLKFEFWRYFTHALMHFSLMHILFNLLWWWYLGGAVEKRLGSGKLIVITLISALLSGYVQQKFSGPWFGGLSGVVYALMGLRLVTW